MLLTWRLKICCLSNPPLTQFHGYGFYKISIFSRYYIGTLMLHGHVALIAAPHAFTAGHSENRIQLHKAKVKDNIN